MVDYSSSETSPPVRGVEAIRAAVETLTGKPGVYHMLDAEDAVLYVGKARNLKKRVSSYTQLERHPMRIQRMITQTARMEIVITANEYEALLLEANLIKKLDPRYNILLKDGKSYPYIKLSLEHDYPRISKYRGQKKGKAEYFGPYASAGAVNQALAVLQKAFLLRPCTDSYFANRSRPCLQYQIKRCSAPCVGYVEQANYGELVQQARDFLTGRSQEVQKTLSRKMEAASEAMQYEEAAALRDRIKALTELQTTQRLHLPQVSEADIIALVREGDEVCVQVIFFRQGQNYGSRTFFPSRVNEQSSEEVMAAFMAQFYQSHPCPKLVLLNQMPEDEAVMMQALSHKEGHQVHLHVPLRGDKWKATQQAAQYAQEALARKQAESASITRHLQKLTELFDLPKMPERIEVYDNSHIMGTNSVGGMIVAGSEGFMPGEYRKFTIRGLKGAGEDGINPGDDYGMMQEVIRRRFRVRTGKEAGKFSTMPDVLLIDGGKGQLSAVLEVMQEMQLEIPVVGIAKGPERNAGREQFFLPGKAPFMLPPEDATLHYLQRLRDEAHRYAIGTHRAKRGKSMVRSALDEIAGVGPKRKKALLHHFGSVRHIEQASLEDLQDVEGINRATAEVVFYAFHPQQ